MYFVYIDESGSKDPRVTGIRADGSFFPKDWLYVLVGISLFEMDWFRFEYVINQRKLQLIDRVRRDTGYRLDLADTEVKSNWVRVPKERAQRRFLSELTPEELTGLVDLYLAQLTYHPCHAFAVVVDKRCLRDFMDEEKLHRKAYELLVERVEWFMRQGHSRHRALMVVDNTSREMNRSLAMKHSYFQREGTSANLRIGHIVEMPMFVESNLSNGVQLADLCAYNVYHAFRYSDLDYPYFRRMEPCLYSAPGRAPNCIEGLKVFPDDSPLVELARQCGERRSVG
jgi:hypothetical protein